MPGLVTLVIPTYNYAHKITRALDSVKNQTLTGFECIVVDDGSTDNTEYVVKEYVKGNVKELDGKSLTISYVRQENSGVAVARNRGISLGDAPFICCLDADDAIAPPFLEFCVARMVEDPSIGIAYTGIWLIDGLGREKAGEWPGEFNYEKQLVGLNQIPTCCVYRREMWVRTGGYRPRYCPKGAGSEDAELWLRAGSIGYTAKKVTADPWFIYSYKTGYVSGNSKYNEINWMIMHPWTLDGIHPFASIAEAKRLSHPVYQYDTPLVSVIIPVSKPHRGDIVFDAIDSVLSQSDRRWEVIVVDDSGIDTPPEAYGNPHILESLPFVRWINTGGNKGAGYARNRGAEAAKAPFLLFLDADDALVPEAIEEFLVGWQVDQGVVYSDYVAKSYISLEQSKRMKDRLINYDTDTGIALIKQFSSEHGDEYDCERAIIQPSDPLYIWNLVTSLVPKAWHDEIGGFDENMESWEDWDYWIRMARTGKCFTYVRRPLVIYRFYTGTRREIGIQSHKKLIQYLIDKYSGANSMSCNCGKSKKTEVQVKQAPAQPSAQKGATDMIDENFVKCIYKSPNRGEHMVYGPVTQRNYGFRPGGDVFYVHKADVAGQPDLFEVIEDKPIAIVQETPPAPPPPPPPSRASQFNKKALEEAKPAKRRSQSYYVENDDVALAPGVTPTIADQLNAMGVFTVQEIAEKLTYEDLIKIEGIADRRATSILEFSKKYAELRGKSNKEDGDEEDVKPQPEPD